MKSPSDKAEEYARENADAQDRELICQASFYAGAEGGYLAGHLEGQKDALNSNEANAILFALQCMIIQFNGSVPGLTPQEVFDGAIEARDKFKAQREGKGG